jgi:vesicle coat complex subunit
LEATDVVAISLRTLGSFPMDEAPLLPLVRDCVVSYLDHPHTLVRREAALTCSRLLIDPTKPVRFRGPSAVVVEEVLQKLLQVMVADPDSAIRLMLIT